MAGAAFADAPFHVGCSAADTVDAAAAQAACDQLLAAATTHSPQATLATPPLSTGPGLDVRIERASDFGLEVTPTWIGADGSRHPQPSVGLRIADRALTDAMRRDFFLRLIDKLTR